MNDAQVREMLRRSGIPREAMVTTLAKERLPDMRRFVTEDLKGIENILVYIYPGPSVRDATVERAELSFYLMAKEMALSGLEGACYDLVDIHTVLFKETDEAFDMERRLHEVDFIAIRHFHDRGGKAEPFMTPYEVAYFTSWLIRQHRDGVGIVLLGGAPLMEAVDWWPASFLGYLRSRATIFEVVL